jgi:hypothetical protein
MDVADSAAVGCLLAVHSLLHTNLILMPTNPKRLSLANFITANILVNRGVGLLEGNWGSNSVSEIAGLTMGSATSA